MSTAELAGLTQGAKAAAQARRGTFHDFLLSEVRTDKGPYTFRKHAVFVAIVMLLDQIVRGREHGWTITGNKAAQIGFSTVTASFCAWATACQNVNVGYFLPDDGFAAEFDKTRVQPIEDSSPLLSGLRSRSEIGVTRYGQNLRYTRGLFSKKGAISIPLDVAAFDEVDFIPKGNLETAQERLNASDLALELYFCRGEIPGAGIDERYREGSRARWVVQCPACGEDGQILEHLWPACVAMGDTGEWERVCVRCRRPYDVQAAGRWVHERPEMYAKRRASFSIPGLVVPQLPLAFVMKRWEEAQGRPSRLAKFRSSVLAIVDAGDRQPLNDQVLGDCAQDYALSLSAAPQGPRVAGLDMGDACWLWVEEDSASGPRLVWVERIDSDRVVEVVAQRCEQLGVRAGVVDSKPLRDRARAICYALPGWAVLDFVGGDSDVPTLSEADHFGKKYSRVVTNRDASLAAFCDDFATTAARRYILPRLAADLPDDRRYALIHLRNLIRDVEQGDDGKPAYRFAKDVENHLGLAGNSARLARLLLEHHQLGGSRDVRMAGAPREGLREQLAGYMETGRGWLRGWRA